LTHFSAGGAGDEAPPEPVAPPESVIEQATDTAPALTIADARLLLALQAERLTLARRRGVAPRRIASDEALTRIARSRPRRLEDPLLVGVADAGAFLAVIARDIGEG
jgi:ATP-dependent DNA helicase RecQ